jgi:acetone carboxylase gamma subunit
VDVEATAELRRRALVERLGREPRPYAGPKFPVLRQITEYLSLVRSGGELWLGCSRCGEVLAPAKDNYKLHCRRIDRRVEFANMLIGDPHRFVDSVAEFRQFCCPACGGVIENEICCATDPVLSDIQLDV